MKGIKLKTREKIINAIKNEYLDYLSIYKLSFKLGMKYNTIRNIINELKNNGGDNCNSVVAGGSAPFPQSCEVMDNDFAYNLEM